jgi:hypothetical protein
MVDEANPTGRKDDAEGVPPGDPEALDLEALAEVVAADLAASEGLVGECVKRALAPYHGMFAPEVLAEMEEDLGCFLSTHPVASAMLARIRPRADRSTSGEGKIVAVEGQDDAIKGQGVG